MRTNIDFRKAAPFYRDERIMEPVGTVALFVAISAAVTAIAVLGFDAPLGKVLWGQAGFLATAIARLAPAIGDGIEAHLAWRRRVEQANRRRAVWG